MNPALVAIAGPLQGTSFPLDTGELTIGRELANTIAISDGSVSRRHSALKSSPEGRVLEDLDSLNGTFVNGVPVKKRIIHNGDQIQIGTSLFCVLLEEVEKVVPAGPVSIEEREIQLGSTIGLRSEPNALLKMRPVGSPLREGSLDLLLGASRLACSAGTIPKLAAGLIDLLLDLYPFDRAAVLLSAEGTEDFRLSFGKDRFSGVGSRISVSRTVLAWVVRDKGGLIAPEISKEDLLRNVESLAAAPIGALAAVPILSRGNVLGVLYGDARKPMDLEEEDLGVLTAFAGMAAAGLERLRPLEWLEKERYQSPPGSAPWSELVGESPEMKRVEQLLARVAPTDTTVLILGESGTGKELAARAIHRGSSRSGGPFIAVNCAALTETLLESELFGHERGAFTGAFSQKRGKLEIADRGTIFLDEIAELSSGLQAKLLRVLQEREFERVGGTRSIRVDIRVVAATNRNLDEALRDGKFREDLYYRLNVVNLRMPALREHSEDIPLLAALFAARDARKLNRSTPAFSPSVRACLLRYDWPGNVRELANAIERAVVLGGDPLGTEDLPEAVLEAGQAARVEVGAYQAAIQETKKRIICRAVAEAEGNYTEAARRLGVHPNYLHRLIRNLDLKADLKK